MGIGSATSCEERSFSFEKKYANFVINESVFTGTSIKPAL